MINKENEIMKKQLIADNKAMRETLEFYALADNWAENQIDIDRWADSDITCDYGHKAKDALEATKEQL